MVTRIGAFTVESYELEAEEEKEKVDAMTMTEKPAWIVILMLVQHNIIH